MRAVRSRCVGLLTRPDTSPTPRTTRVELYRTLRKAKKLGMVSLPIRASAQHFATPSTEKFPITDKRQKAVTGVDGRQAYMTLRLHICNLRCACQKSPE